jgi:hypothetical protein
MKGISTAANASRKATLVWVKAAGLMGKGRGVDQDKIDSLVPGVLDPLHQFVFGVALHCQQVVTLVPGLLFKALVDVCQCGTAIDVGFPFPEQIQVGPV